jgi:prevent-host-death family protein
LIVVVISVRMTYMKTMASAAELKAHLSEYLRAAEHGRAVLITRHGKAVAALVSADELAQLQRLRAAGPQAGLASVAGGWRGSEDLVQHLARIRRTAPRRVVRLAAR